MLSKLPLVTLGSSKQGPKLPLQGPAVSRILPAQPPPGMGSDVGIGVPEIVYSICFNMGAQPNAWEYKKGSMQKASLVSVFLILFRSLLMKSANDCLVKTCKRLLSGKVVWSPKKVSAFGYLKCTTLFFFRVNMFEDKALYVSLTCFLICYCNCNND